MVRAPSVRADAAFVLTPSGLHAKHICELAELSVPNIIVEKPIALALEDAHQAIKACELQESRLFVVKQWRYNRAVQQLRGAFESGRFGKISLLTARLRWCRHDKYYQEANWRGTWAQDGGVLTNQAVHAIDLLLWFGGKVEQVFAMCQTRLASIEAEDTAVAVIRFANGTLGTIEASTAVRPANLEASLSVLGSGGSVVVGGNSVNRVQTWQFENPEPQDDVVLESGAENPTHDPNYAHRCYLDDVLESIELNREGGVGGAEALRSLELIHALYHSDSLGESVALNSGDFSGSRLGRDSNQPVVVPA